jgi:protein-S-isoprenylcysteine O-methyltransferase Ste14
VDGNRGWQWRNVPLPEIHLFLIGVGAILNLRWPRRVASAWRVRLLGGPLIIAGAVLAAWATRTAGQVDLERPDRLVTGGPYAVSRHPMYVAWTLIYLGVALMLNVFWLLILLPLLGLLTHREARREEKRLEDAFGQAYRTYRRRVRRYL